MRSVPPRTATPPPSPRPELTLVLMAELYVIEERVMVALPELDNCHRRDTDPGPSFVVYVQKSWVRVAAAYINRTPYCITRTRRRRAVEERAVLERSAAIQQQAAAESRARCTSRDGGAAVHLASPED